MELRFLSYGDVWSAILDSIPRLRQYNLEAVTYIPRGGMFPASVIAHTLELPLLAAAEVAHSGVGRCLLVDDIVVSGRTLAQFQQRHLKAAGQVLTYAFADVPRLRAADCTVDLVSVSVDERFYLLLPWEFGDLLEPGFPFAPLFELDGVFRSGPQQPAPLLATPYRIPHLVSFSGEPRADQEWLERHGYRCGRLLDLPASDAAPAIAAYMADQHLCVYVGADTERCRALKRLRPESYVFSFRDMCSL